MTFACFAYHNKDWLNCKLKCMYLEVYCIEKTKSYTWVFVMSFYVVSTFHYVAQIKL